MKLRLRREFSLELECDKLQYSFSATPGSLLSESSVWSEAQISIIQRKLISNTKPTYPPASMNCIKTLI